MIRWYYFTLLALAVSPCGQARADINAVYDMAEHHVDGKSGSGIARYSLTSGQVVMVMKGDRSARIIFDRKQDLLRVVDDTGKKYLDLDSKTLDQLGASLAGAFAEMQKSLAGLPPAQRAMAESMLTKTGGAGAGRPPAVFVKRDETKSIAGYACGRYDLMSGEAKRAEVWTCTQPDFRMTPEEVETIRAMQDRLGRFVDAMGPMATQIGGSGLRAFQYDRSVEGFPVRTACFDGDRMALELTLTKVDHEPIDKTLLELSAEYKKQELSLPQPGR